MKNFWVKQENIESRQLSAKTNLFNAIETLWLQGVITEGLKTSLTNEINKINTDPYYVVLDLVGKQLEVEEGKEKFLIEVIKKEQSK